MMPALLPDPAPRKYRRPRPTPDLPPLRATRVLHQLRERLRLMHYSLRTEETYVYWVKAFIRFHGLRHPAEMGGPEVEAFLTHLADDRSVAPSTHSQALSAQLFFYTKVLRHDLPWLQEIGHPRRHRRLPVVLSAEEVRGVLAGLQGEHLLLARLRNGRCTRCCRPVRPPRRDGLDGMVEYLTRTIGRAADTAHPVFDAAIRTAVTGTRR